MFLANENFPRPSILYLRNQGYYVVSIQETYQGIPDNDVLQIAKDQGLIILTFDRDYGELIFRYAVDNPPSVFYFRSKGDWPLFVGKFLHELLVSIQIDISAAFTVVDKDSIRQRFYTRCTFMQDTRI
jgi:predicted nuclease of predicted toxin-antitoxin system